MKNSWPWFPSEQDVASTGFVRIMRVMLITGSFPPIACGVGAYCHQLALALACAPEIQLAVLTSKETEFPEAPRNVEFLPTVAKWGWREANSIVTLIRDWAPDLVHIQLPAFGYRDGKLPYWLPLRLHLAGITVVQTWHTAYWGRVRDMFTFSFLTTFVPVAIASGGLVLCRKNLQETCPVAFRWGLHNKTVRFIQHASMMPSVNLSATERRALRSKYSRPGAHMIVYFGFIREEKGTDRLFQIVNPDDSHLVIIGDTEFHFAPGFRSEEILYCRSIRRLAESGTWKGKVTMTGFLPDAEAARVLAAADAVVLPFPTGGGEWSTSILAAQTQGTFVLTTSEERRGYDPDGNTYFASTGDLQEMKGALSKYVGKQPVERRAPIRGWKSICDEHVDLYRTQMMSRGI
jgi:glycosyltransferase involved in cell wall biosynthesis